MSQRKCLRCGNEWWDRKPWNFQYGTKLDHVPKRCARCRSPYWNKPYVRRIASENRNAGSSFDAQTIPLLHCAGITVVTSHVAGTVRSKKLSRPAIVRSKSGVSKCTTRKLAAAKRVKSSGKRKEKL